MGHTTTEVMIKSVNKKYEINTTLFELNFFVKYLRPCFSFLTCLHGMPNIFYFWPFYETFSFLFPQEWADLDRNFTQKRSGKP